MDGNIFEWDACLGKLVEVKNKPTIGGLEAELTAARQCIKDLAEALEIARDWGYGQPPSTQDEELIKSTLAKHKAEIDKCSQTETGL